MTDSTYPACQIVAVVQDVWPITGLAYVMDEGRRTWGITRSTAGTGLQHLQPGQRVELTVVKYKAFDLVSAYAPLN
jgi:hypothetical protein